jgi:hypothetical protein
LGWNRQLAFVEEPELTLSSQTGVRELSPKAHDTGLELKLAELLLPSTVASIFEWTTERLPKRLFLKVDGDYRERF